MITPINVSINPHIDDFCELPEIWVTYDRSNYEGDMFPEDRQYVPGVMFPDLQHINNIHNAYFSDELLFFKYAIKCVMVTK
jgi:hypothetical protein